MADEMLSLSEAMNVNIKTKIQYKGQEYSDPGQLPPEVRSAFDKATASGAVTKIMVNGQELASQDQNVRKLCDDVMSVIENNGEVTLPSVRSSDPLITKHQILLVLALVSTLVLVVWLFLNR
jgi:hypothetical protein